MSFTLKKKKIQALNKYKIRKKIWALISVKLKRTNFRH